MQESKILFLGDLLIDGRSYTTLKRLAKIAKNYAAIFVNLECALRPGNNEPIRSPFCEGFAESFQFLKEVPNLICSLANNHLGDFGLEGIELTRQTLDGLGVQYFGTKDRPNITVGDYIIHSWVEMDTNPSKSVPVLDCLSLQRPSYVKGYRNVAYFHGLGNSEYALGIPRNDGIDCLEQLSDEYDFVIGCHTHTVLGPYALGNSKVVMASLGNFYFPALKNSSLVVPPLLGVDKCVGVEIAKSSKFITVKDLWSEEIRNSQNLKKSLFLDFVQGVYLKAVNVYIRIYNRIYVIFSRKG